MDRPTLFVTNLSFAGGHGPGAKFGVMLNPRPFERADGRVVALTYPNTPLFQRLLHAARQERDEQPEGDIGPAMAALKASYEAHLQTMEVEEGDMMASTNAGEVHVKDGDTLFCCCSRAHAAQGRCHRVWMVPKLQEAGWDVVLDGVRVPPLDEPLSSSVPRR